MFSDTTILSIVKAVENIMQSIWNFHEVASAPKNVGIV